MRQALCGATIFDGEQRATGGALLIENGVVAGIVEPGQIPPDYSVETLDGGLLTAGFVDIQVNGGGGVMLNDQTDSEAMDRIARAHRRFGTTTLLPTLITDTPERTARAISAAQSAVSSGIAGVGGLHLEGPHLSLARRGAHDPSLIRPMTDADLEILTAAAQSLPSLYLTVAPESVSVSQIQALSDAGAVVSLGHTDCDAKTARAAFDAGATAATHLFNAMSQLGNREPGLVGAVLDDGRVWSAFIADGIHVDPTSLSVALRSKKGPARLFLVTDAMSTIGTDLKSFELNGREIRREKGRLTLADGTLAGADLDMISAVRFSAHTLGLGVDEALRMAALYPAQMLGRSDLGALTEGARADVLWLDESTLSIRAIWQNGLRVEAGSGQNLRV